MTEKVTATARAHARALAKKLRNGTPISFCDHTIALRDGKVIESAMVYNAFVGHDFADTQLNFGDIRRALLCGAFR